MSLACSWPLKSEREASTQRTVIAFFEPSEPIFLPHNLVRFCSSTIRVALFKGKSSSPHCTPLIFAALSAIFQASSSASFCDHVSSNRWYWSLNCARFASIANSAISFLTNTIMPALSIRYSYRRLINPLHNALIPSFSVPSFMILRNSVSSPSTKKTTFL